MMIETLPEVVGHILCHALGVVIVNVAGDRADQGDQHSAARRHPGQGQRVLAVGEIAQPPQELGQLVLPDYVINDDLQRPGRGDAHGRFDEHGDEDDD